MKCPKCDGEMEEGITKNWGGYVGKNQWGKILTFFGGVTEAKDVVTYRCKECGYLESYAK